MYGGRANMNLVKKNYFDNSKVRADYYDILACLISQKLDAIKNLTSFIQSGDIRTSHTSLYNYGNNIKRKFKGHGTWEKSSYIIDRI